MKSKELKYIFGICKFEQDPNSELFYKIFKDVEFPNLGKLNENKDRLVKRLLENVPKDVEVVTSEKELEKVIEQDIDEEHYGRYGYSRRFVTKQPILIDSKKGFLFEGNSFGAQRIYMGKGCKFEHSVIHSPTYMQEGAAVEFSIMPAERRAQFLGYGAKISHASECRGAFVSGYMLKKDIPAGWQNTYLHTDSINNLIAGAGSDLCGGTKIMNHPEAGEKPRIIHPIEKKVINITDRKIPIIFGMNASVGSGIKIHYGTVVGANEQVFNIKDLHGLVEYGKIFMIRREPSHEIKWR